jgi:hypothetical protein
LQGVVRVCGRGEQVGLVKVLLSPEGGGGSDVLPLSAMVVLGVALATMRAFAEVALPVVAATPSLLMGMQRCRGAVRAEASLAV